LDNDRHHLRGYDLQRDQFLNEPSARSRGESFAHLGYPDYFKTELTIAKILGVLALLIPSIPATLKEFAYFGFAIVLVSASIAHFSIGDGLMFVLDPLIFFGVLIVSYAYFRNRCQLRSRLKT
jgi:hypothetical protein